MATPQEAFVEIGATGLQVYSGYVDEEQLRELRGARWPKIVRAMSENDSTCAAVLQAIEMLARQASWKIQPSTQDQEDLEIAEFIQGALFDDLSQSWSDALSEILSMNTWGWCVTEIVYKQRKGDTNDPKTKSRFTDGRIGWRKFAIRAQETLSRWEFDDSGGIQAMVQSAPPTYRSEPIPFVVGNTTKALLFRTTSKKNNPEGRSILRAGYTDWYRKHHIGRIEGIGIERDLAGLPVALVPPELLSPNATAEQKALLAEIKKIVTNIRQDEQAALIFPLVYNKEGKLMYKLELLSTGGRRQFDTNLIYQRYDVGIATAMLADFLKLGHEKVGSFALSTSKIDLFSTAITGYLDSIAGIFNRHAIPSLLKLNAIKAEKLPELQHGGVKEISPIEVATYVKELSGAGFDVAGVDGLLTHLLQRIKLPIPEEQEKKKEESMSGEESEEDEE